MTSKSPQVGDDDGTASASTEDELPLEKVEGSVCSKLEELKAHASKIMSALQPQKGGNPFHDDELEFSYATKHTDFFVTTHQAYKGRSY
jgi:hypothetical protein